MSLASIMRSRREELGLTQELVAARAGMSKPYLSNIETGKAGNPPSDGKLRLLERALSFRPGELLKIAHLEKTPVDVRQAYEKLAAELQWLRRVAKDQGEGQWDEAGVRSVEPPFDDETASRELSAGLLVPIINKVAAGYPRHFTDLDYPPGVAEEYIRFPDVHDPQAFAAYVSGDSMEPEYHEGDIVVFSPNTEARSGDDCFVRFEVGEETTLKRVYEDDDATLRLQPLNNAYPAQLCPRTKITGLWPALLKVQHIRRP